MIYHRFFHKVKSYRFVIKHMHYDASGSDQSICGILYQIAKTTTIGIMDKSGFLMVDLRPVPKTI